MSDIKRNPQDTPTDPELGEVLFEVITMGNAVRVAAIDPATNIEVTVVGSVHTTPYSLKVNALRKLKRALAKRRES